MTWISGIFKKNKKLPPFDLASIGADMHSHLIPSIDDGAQSMDESIGMINKFKELGFKKIITTPHVMSDYYKNTPEIILGGIEKVKKELESLKIPVEINAAAEYYVDEFLLDKIKSNNILSFGNTKKYVLFEFSFTSEPLEKNNVIFQFLQSGYTPVLAHFERYMFFFSKPIEKAQDLKQRGVKIQVNLLSLTGHYGKKIQEQAEILIDNKLVDFVGTDCHRMEHLETLEQNLHLPYFHKLNELDLLNREL